jgi:hypothetical protein
VCHVRAALELDESHGVPGHCLSAPRVCLDAVHGYQLVRVRVDVRPRHALGKQPGLVQLAMELGERIFPSPAHDPERACPGRAKHINRADDEFGERAERAGADGRGERDSRYAQAEYAWERVVDERLGRERRSGWSRSGLGDCAGERGLS